ncbi:putative peptidoglycan binding protein,Sel1 repeat protein [Phyllobacterium sp. YR531]|nr:putative peptidoglycan binding protein,Sel1 repeat protein [Phyllobacterium sp. YR531]
MEQVNVNRARRDATSLDNLNRTLEALESQLRNAMQPKRPEPELEGNDIADRFAALASRAGLAPSPRRESPSQNGKHDLSAVAAQLKQLRAEMRNNAETANSSILHNTTLSRLQQSSAPANHFSNTQPDNASTISMLRGDLNELKQAVAKLGRNDASHHASMPARYMQQIDDRLDEISRAIVATSQQSSGRFAEADAFERLEARIASLATSVQASVPDRTSDVILQRMGELAQRVDNLTEQAKRPSVNIDALSEHLAAVARHLQNAPAAISISDFRDLEDRVLQVINKLETMPQQPAIDPLFSTKVDQRFAELTERLDKHHQINEHSDIRLTDSIESRFDDMARFIAENVPQTDKASDAIHNLELQIAGLAEHLAKSNDSYAEIAAIPPRLDAIEESIASSRDFIVETARNAATEAIRNMAEVSSAHDSAVARELAGDLKTLEGLARKSEDRNTKTFEAIHDTLLKIVDRLASLESGPIPVYRAAPDQTMQESVITEPVFDAPVFSKAEEPRAEINAIDDSDTAGTEPRERTSLFGSLTRGLKGRNKLVTPQDPDIEMELDEPDLKSELDSSLLNRPLEPGSGMPDLNSILKRVRDDRREMQLAGSNNDGKADFIAAARRAAQAAALEMENQQGSEAVHDELIEEGSLKRGFLARQRKPILLAIGAIMIAIVGLQLKAAFLDTSAKPQATASTIAPATKAPAPLVQKPAPVAPARELAAVQPAPVSVESVIAAQQQMPSTVNDAVDTNMTTQSVPAAAPESLAIPTIPTEGLPDELHTAIVAGDNKALFEVGDRYMDGRGFTSDYAKAAEWYRLAAERGFAPAQYRIGNFYEKGLGVDKDAVKAIHWYELAAGQGNASAMHNLAVLLAAGVNGAPDNEGAARWFTRAAELGVKDSQFNLAILSAKGVGLKQNLEESYKWFAIAAEAGDKDAASKRDDVAHAMNPDQLARAKAATALWKPKSMDADANALNIPEQWREVPLKTGSLDMEKAVRNIQLILNKNGYDAGGSDGRIGTKTREAIMAFQKDNGLKPTGSIDKDLVRNLLQKNG